MDVVFGESAARISTKRLELVPLASDDAAALWPYMSEPEISRLMSWSPHGSPAVTAAFIADVRAGMRAGSTVCWTIRENGEVGGLVSLVGILHKHRALTYDNGVLAYWLGRAFRGRGIATEACEAVMRYAFETMGLHKLIVAHVSENDRSRKMIARLGFRLVGIERQHFIKDGRWFDHEIYELLRSDWGAGRSASGQIPEDLAKF